MKKNKSRPNPEEFVQFWNFWKWQYMCRNREYREAYNEYINVEIPKWIYDEALKIFGRDFSESSIRLLLDAAEEEVPTPIKDLKLLFKLEDLWPINSTRLHFRERTAKWCAKRRKPFDVQFLCSPKDPNKDNDSEEILRNTLNHTLKKDINNLNLKTFEKDVVETFDPSCRFTFFVDTEKKPIDQVIAEITYWYAVHSPIVGSKKIKSAHAKLVSEYIDQVYPGFKVDYADRAIGLWLWDHKKKMEENSGKEYPITKATRDLYKVYDLEKRGYGSLTKNPITTLRRIRRYYHAALDSIKHCQILPINPSK